MLPSCFKNPSTPTSGDGNQRRQQPAASSLITCTYQTELFSNSQIQVALTWSKTLTSHNLIFHSPELFSIPISLSPSRFSIFRARPGSKSVPITNTHNPDSVKEVRLYWDFTRVEFSRADSAEPDSSFYLALVCDGRVAFFLGDRRDDLTRRVSGLTAVPDSAESGLVSRREHLFGRRSYSTTARFLNSKHEIEIECKSGTMRVRIDGKTKLVVKKLVWKFRGNERILIGGLEINFSWDVFNWVSADKNGGNGVFVFRVGEGGGAWPEMTGPEKKLMRKCSSPAATRGTVSPTPSWSSSVLQWAEESSDCGKSSASNSSTPRFSAGGSGNYGGNGGGFSLVLYAWRREIEI